MKKHALSLAFLLALSAAAWAQGSFKLGLRVGSTMYKIDGQSFKDGFNFGYHIGGAMEIMFGKKLGIQPEMLFNHSKVETGSNLNNLVQGLNPSRVAGLDYLTIPLLLNYRSNKVLNLQAGPQFGVMVSQSNTLLQNAGSAFKNGDLSLLGGIQLNLAMFRVYGRYGIGLSNINDIGSQQKWKSQMIQLGVGLKL